MTTQNERLRALVGKWREAQRTIEKNLNVNFSYGSFTQCADELEAILAEDKGTGQEANLGDLIDHGMNCPALNPMDADECRCGLEYRRMAQTEREMHNAWRKRAEEAEAALAVPPFTDAFNLAQQRVTIVERAMKLPYIKATRDASVGPERFIARDDLITLVHALSKEAAPPSTGEPPK